MDASSFIAPWDVLLEVLISGVVVYGALVIMLRTTGKRTLAKFNAFDFVVTIALGSMVAGTIIQPSITVAQGLLGLAVLVVTQLLVSKLVTHSHQSHKLIKSKPRLLFYEGQFLRDNLVSERVATEEILATVRRSGFARLEDVRLVVLETDGSMSVISRNSSENPEDTSAPLDALDDVERGRGVELPRSERLPPVGKWEDARRGKSAP